MKRRLQRLALAFGGLGMVATLALVISVFGWHYPVETLAPDRDGPLLLQDRQGRLLRSVPHPTGRPGRAAWVSLHDLPPRAVLAVVASEDARFHDHVGVDPWGLLRAAWLDLRAGRAAYGGSTLTMQLVRMVDSVGEKRTPGAKVRESILALRLERAMSKSMILEQYLNRAYYGNGAYGLDAAARTYFGKPATALGPGEATLLAVLPRGPKLYDPIRHLANALRRRHHVLRLLVARNLLTGTELAVLEAEPLRPSLHPLPLLAPHFTEQVLADLPPEVRARGGTVQTTLDLDLQLALEKRISGHVAELAPRRLQQAGMVVLDTASGQVRAMAGSAAFRGDGGQLDITARRRHPGSALKPFVYALAIEDGAHPATIAHDTRDVPSAYRVQRLSQPERGPVRFREALAGSYNLAAVHVLEQVGIERLLSKLATAGLGPLPGSPRDYGLRLALGAAKVRLVDLAGAYGFLARRGKVVPPSRVLGVRFADGTTWQPAPALEQQVFTPETSHMVLDMLADAEARRPAFGDDLPLDLPFPVAAKTGTSRGFADTVAVAVTREVTVAAWAGNFDGEPTRGLVGMEAAAPLVRAGLLLAAAGRPLTLPEPPPGLATREVCPVSGQARGVYCPGGMRELGRMGRADRPCERHMLDAEGRVTVRWPRPLARQL